MTKAMCADRSLAERSASVGVIRRNEARRIAINIVKLPDLLGKVRPDDQAVGNLSDERHEAEDTTPKGEA